MGAERALEDLEGLRTRRADRFHSKWQLQSAGRRVLRWYLNSAGKKAAFGLLSVMDFQWSSYSISGSYSLSSTGLSKRVGGMEGMGIRSTTPVGWGCCRAQVSRIFQLGFHVSMSCIVKTWLGMSFDLDPRVSSCQLNLKAGSQLLSKIPNLTIWHWYLGMFMRTSSS